jgi:hypothetical protein
MSDASQTILYSGGHRGAEAEFGKLAEKYGMKEVNFSFEGHNLDRNVGVKMLNTEELEKGNISMDIVSARMGRSFSRVNKIRKVIQSIFHMINNGYQIFVIGWILPDKTVKGGTGWGVELGKLFNRPIFVYEQDRKEWFSWIDNSWQQVAPVISHKTFTGTGTRNLTEDAKHAMEDLFKRSFK